MNNIEVKKIFNPNGDDSLENKKIIKGNSTNLFNLNEVKYTWAKSSYREQIGNFWIPERVGLERDKNDYNNKLNDKERTIYNSILSFLTFLDSLQTNNIPKICDYITASEVSTLLSIQDFMEVIHSQSYSYIIESVIPKENRKMIYELWRENKVLFERNKYIASIYQEFWDKQDDKSFAKVLIANYILEGLYFYNGFMFFYNLATRDLMLGTADIIRLINRDEQCHCDTFANIILTINQEIPDFIDKQMVYDLFDYACKEEIKWSNHILENSDIVGLNKTNTEKFTKQLVNKRLQAIGLDILYPDNFENPYQYLELQSDSDSKSLRSNFFESKNTNYSQSNVFKDWDLIDTIDL